MAGGHWGRVPVENFICTKIVFFMLAYGLARRRLINRVKRIFSLSSKAALRNAPSTPEAFRKWMDRGYDKVNIGGGPVELEGFVNIDFVAYPNVQRHVVANILDLSFVSDECVSHVHSNHVVEHFTEEDLKNQIREWDRILKKDGLLTIRCPNALGAAYGFWFEPVIEGGKEEFVRLGFPADEAFGDPADRWVHKNFFGLLHWLYGDAGNIANQHLSRITPSMLQGLLAAQGFTILKMTEPEALNIAVVARKGPGMRVRPPFMDRNMAESE